MCFSASASFIVGASLSIIGVATINKAETKAEIPFAMIPLLFGIQQLIEGVIWLTFNHEAPLVKKIMTYLYSVFSHAVWPIFVPIAIGFLETVRWRKRAIFVFGVAGFGVGLYLLYHIIISPVVAEVIGNHIAYSSIHFHKLPVMAVYLLTTCATCFFSSHHFVKLFGVLALFLFMISFYIQATAFFSIWCFFAAILSVLIYLHLRFRNLGGFPKMAV